MFLVISQADVQCSKFVTSASPPPQRRKTVEPALSAICSICAHSQQPRTASTTQQFTWHNHNLLARTERCWPLTFPCPNQVLRSFKPPDIGWKQAHQTVQAVSNTSNTKGSSLLVLACLLLEAQPTRSSRIYLKPPITFPFGCHLVCQIFTVELKCPQDIGLCNGNNDLYELGVTVPNKPFPSVRVLFCS